MNKKQIKNIGASVLAKLLKMSREQNLDFNRLLMLYLQEGFLHRLSISQYKELFILKGGVLLYSTYLEKARPTKDVDFLVQNLSNQLDEFLQVIKRIVSINIKDGIFFKSSTIKVTRIIKAADYPGLRTIIPAQIDTAQQRLQVDVGFGNISATTPIQLKYPRLLESKSISITAYSWETVVSEKFESIVRFGEINSRIKDFHDLNFLIQHHCFKGKELKESIQETFNNCNTDITESSYIFSDSFLNDKQKQRQWISFLQKFESDSLSEFVDVMENIMKFLDPVVQAIVEKKSFDYVWDTNKINWKKCD